MLGAVADAEDMVQETFIRWQQASGEEVRSPKAFLVTIIRRLCINHLESARVRAATAAPSSNRPSGTATR
jgi:RNA polymerase sigma-70 factor (ECF subfamily)